MGTIYTSVNQIGREDIIVLNPKYSRDQIAEKLKPLEYSEERLDQILTRGVNLQKDLRVKCRSDGCITTQKWGSRYFFYKGDTVIVQPDGVFSIKPGIFRRIRSIMIRSWLSEVLTNTASEQILYDFYRKCLLYFLWFII